MHLRRLTAVLAASTTMLLPTAVTPTASAGQLEGRVSTGSWAPLTPSLSVNFADATVARAADGTQHVVWMVDNPDRTHNYEHTTISPSGAQGPVSKVLPTNWSQLGTPVDLGVNPDGSLRLAFRGSIDGSTADFFSYKGVYTAVSGDGGLTWAVPREVLVKTHTIGGVTMAYTATGAPITGFGDTGGFHWSIGSTPEAALSSAVVAEFTDHDAMGASLVSSGGVVHVVYQSSRLNAVFARQVWPTLGAPVQAPGTHTIPHQPISVVDRPGVGPVAALVVAGKVVLWDISSNSTHPVRGMDGASNASLAALPDGHLWVAAQGPIGYTPRASRVAASGWDVDRRPTELDDLYSTFGVVVSSVDALRAELVVPGAESGDPVRMHAQSVEAQMSVKASPGRWRAGRAQKVVFKVTDVDGGVSGAKVRAAGKRCTTNGAGKCKIKFRAYPRPRKITVKVTRDGYVPVKLKLKVKR
ncbi:hypothetical protein EXE58_07645 [Nocardioides seonyuensis]|uniref:Carboxypeptidase regulatory-like domain-containing protein n=1 Tax=Nocardioides seonyuensis TaxID=2518371 RepID=A0A4P7IF00_9ACTN|nr:hypothetical protein [Nocardioides seonyuensis]QBX55340.1 hypothetical protein EXE58_07645 [Nocardioides seonyuensis]